VAETALTVLADLRDDTELKDGFRWCLEGITGESSIAAAVATDNGGRPPPAPAEPLAGLEDCHSCMGCPSERKMLLS